MQISSLMSSGGAEAALAMRQSMFKSADADGDGKLSATEAQSMKPSGPPPGPPPAMAGGTMGSLLQAQEESQRPSLEDLLAEADADADGSLTFDELEAAGSRRMEALQATKEAQPAEATGAIDWEALLAALTEEKDSEAA